MKPQLSQAADQSIDAELDRLTYSAYLLTLDPRLAFSVVMTALDNSLDVLGGNASLLVRTIELSLQQLRHKAASGYDRESSAAEVALYGDYKVRGASRILRMNEDAGSKVILSLNSASRVAFVLHQILGYAVKEAADMAEMSEKEYRAHLRNAYVQLASTTASEALASTAIADAARA